MEITKNKALRLIDANFNRSSEALRVLEDVARYLLDLKDFSLEFKLLRHGLKLSTTTKIELLENRDINNDILKNSIKDELKRENLLELLIANFKRAQEALRSLEEIAKFCDIEGFCSDDFKDMRYKVYDLEIKLLRLENLS